VSLTFGQVVIMLMDHSYEHHSMDEPAILLGGAFMSEVVENVEEENKQ